MTKFFLFVIATLSALYLYLGFRLSIGAGPSVWVVLGVMVVGMFCIMVFLRRRPGKDLWVLYLKWLNFLNMGFLSFLFTFTVLRDVIFLPVSVFNSEVAELAFGPQGVGAVVALSLIAVAIGFWKAARGPRVVEVDIPLENLPEELHGFRIAQISDLHIGTTIKKPYVERVVRKVNAMMPHVTVLTGDIVDGHLDELKDDVVPLRDLTPQGSVLYVPGNHEYYYNGPRWIEHLESHGLRALLNDRYLHIHNGREILIAGVVDPAARIADPTTSPDPRKAQEGPHQAKVKILLAHQPGIALEAQELGYDLQISGHTHGGQFFPWTLVVRKIHAFSQGLKSAGTMWVYVNPGTGSWGPPIRFGTSTEISILRLVKRK